MRIGVVNAVSMATATATLKRRPAPGAEAGTDEWR